jgi:putative lysine transport system permease protein
MNKEKRKYIHIRVLLIASLVIFFGIKSILLDVDRISFIKYINIPVGIFAILLGALSLLILGLKVFNCIKLKDPKKVLKIIYLINSIIALIFMLEFIGLPIIQSFIDSAGLSRIPSKENFLDSMTYILINHYKQFLKGILMTLLLSLSGTLIGLLIAFVFVIIRTMKINKKDNEVIAFFKNVGIWFVKIYVNIFRGTPMMVQAVIIYYLLPMFIASTFNIPQTAVDKVLTITVSGIIIVSLNTTAYLVEVLRGGIEAIDKGQMEAARSLGFTYWGAMFNIILPQAIKNVLPSIINEFIINIKDTSVLNVIAVAELFFVTQDVKLKYFRTYEPFIIAALIYLFLTLATSKLLVFVEKKFSLSEVPLPSSN